MSSNWTRGSPGELDTGTPGSASGGQLHTRLHAQTVGEGPDVALVHGLAANLSFWYLHVVPYLSRRFRVTVYDLRGHGRSEMPSHGYTTAHMACDLIALLDHLRIEQVHLVGHSFGGAVALHTAVLAPERVLTLSLADARVPALQPLPRQGDAKLWDTWRDRIHHLGGEVDSATPHVLYGFIEEILREEQADGTVSVAARSPGLGAGPRARKRWQVLLRTTTALREVGESAGLTHRRIAGLSVPVLASYGELSHSLPTYWALAALLPGLEGQVIPQVGHFHPIVRPREFADMLTDFWLRHQPVKPSQQVLIPGASR